MKGAKTGGRQKGVPNKRSVEMREAIEKRLGQSIPEKLVDWAEELHDMGEVADAAAALDKAAKYLYPTLKAVELTGKVEHQMPEPIEQGPAPK